MLLDYTQRQGSIIASYANEKGTIDTVEVPLPNGYFNFTACDETDPGKEPGLTSFYGEHIKREPSKYFQHHSVNYFFDKELERVNPNIFRKINQTNMPNPYSVDLEMDIDPIKGYATPDDPFNAIRSISITDIRMVTILFIVKNPDHPVITADDRSEINAFLHQSLGKHASRFEYQYDIRIFETEIEMMNTFLEMINNYFHYIVGWNFLDFDWQYILERCKRYLNIDVSKASPLGRLTPKRVEIKKNQTIKINVPAHRIVDDYMLYFRWSLVYNNLGSYSLNSCSELVLGLHKVMFDGNLRTLYINEYIKFIAYALMDTILVMLIHKETNLAEVDFFQSYYTGVAYQKITQNSISEALVYKKLMSWNKLLLESEKTNNPVRDYPGGYVKDPLRKNVVGILVFDFSALYPRTMITMGLSPEAKMDIIPVDEDGIPVTEADRQKWEKYKTMGFCLAPTGRVYDKSKTSLYVAIEQDLLAERKVFSGHKDDIYLNILPNIEEELKKRGLAIS